jgi:uncharacterized protein (TIGR02301 family)
MNLRLFFVVFMMFQVGWIGETALAQTEQLNTPGAAQSATKPRQPAVDPDARPYDAQIYRLSEILGAVHYLRALCGTEEGQVWRNQMRDLVNAEGTNPLRRAVMRGPTAHVRSKHWRR